MFSYQICSEHVLGVFRSFSLFCTAKTPTPLMSSLCTLCIVSVPDKTQLVTFQVFPECAENVSVLLRCDSVSMHYLLPHVSTTPTCLVFKDRKLKEPNTQTQHHAQKKARVKTQHFVKIIFHIRTKILGGNFVTDPRKTCSERTKTNPVSDLCSAVHP